MISNNNNLIYNKLNSLTSLRFFAALIVLIAHSILWFPSSKYLNIFRFGYLGVPFFFILSGFVLNWSYEQSTYTNFLLRRIARIYPLHLLMFVLCLITKNIFDSPLAGSSTSRFGMMANILMLQSWFYDDVTIRQGWNGVSWTLSCEVFFYICSPFIFKILNKTSSLDLFLRCGCIIYGILLLYTAYVSVNQNIKIRDMMLFLPLVRLFEYISGALVAEYIKRYVKNTQNLTFNVDIINNILNIKVIIIFMLLPIIIFCLVSPYTHLGLYFPSLLILPGSLLLLSHLALRDISGTEKRILTNPFLVKLGDLSFTVYMTHQWLLGITSLFIQALMKYCNYNITSMYEVHALYFTILLLSILNIHFISYFINKYFETPIRLYLLKLASNYKY